MQQHCHLVLIWNKNFGTNGMADVYLQHFLCLSFNCASGGQVYSWHRVMGERNRTGHWESLLTNKRGMWGSLLWDVAPTCQILFLNIARFFFSWIIYWPSKSKGQILKSRYTYPHAFFHLFYPIIGMTKFLTRFYKQTHAYSFICFK